MCGKSKPLKSVDDGLERRVRKGMGVDSNVGQSPSSVWVRRESCKTEEGAGLSMREFAWPSAIGE